MATGTAPHQHPTGRRRPRAYDSAPTHRTTIIAPQPLLEEARRLRDPGAPEQRGIL